MGSHEDTERVIYRGSDGGIEKYRRSHIDKEWGNRGSHVDTA